MEIEKFLLSATLCFLVKNDKVLLPIKNKKIGKGKRNGYGGGVDGQESFKECAVREVREESGGVMVIPDDLENAAIMYFYNTKSDEEKFICKVYVYIIRKWIGEPENTDEMKDPRWFEIDNLPISEMMPADKEWLPYILKGEKIIGKAEYGPFQKELLAPVEIKKVEVFEEEF